ncbi:aldehyde dehydrogenase family protein [Amycolatopsis palatopharyngis]|uniref:aldehyde dehydrogenase family protein n=1 Tax=Amycolatopsis palatopharyngis TaxID=187982 RepID=UPI000E274DF3|nr:aldehyde dehydrogenase family protein [Amycolatopsis palatopharyngis]
MIGAEYQGDVFVDGVWRPVPAKVAVHDPATGAVVGHAADAGAGDADRAVAAAARQLPVWAEVPYPARAAVLADLAGRLRERRAELIDTVVAEVGCPVTVTAEFQVDVAIEVVEHYAALVRTRTGREEVANSVLHEVPAGVVATITPWNYPLYQLAAKVAPALAAGCTVVAKPAELTPLSAYLFAEAISETALPPGVFNLVPGSGRVVGAALAAHPDVDVVSFTGSTAVGTQVMAAAAGSVKRVCLELGGKSASVVLPEADIEEAVAATVASATLNSGQTCSAWTRLVVPEHHYSMVLEQAEAGMRAVRVGDPRDAGTENGPLVSADQRERVAGFVSRAEASGARVLGRRGDLPGYGHYCSPLVVADSAPDWEIAQEEVFGPVLVVLPYRTEVEALRIATGTRYGLHGAVWGEPERAADLARRMRTGQVDVNGAAATLRAPFGGLKQSGIGRELGLEGLREFVELVAVQR